MTDETDKIYRRASLADYSLKERSLIRIADLGFYLLIKLIGGSCRFETLGAEHLEAISSSGRLPIYATWHDRIFSGTYYLQKRGIVFLASQSFDGEYITRFLQRFGYGVIRGSSTRGGARGLVEMIRAMKRGMAMGFTVDGPKGPRYVAKPGPVILAKKTGNPILPFIVQPRKFRTLNSWDKMHIPSPFSKTIVIIGEPIYVNADADAKMIENKLLELQRSLDQLVIVGNDWKHSFKERS